MHFVDFLVYVDAHPTLQSALINGGMAFTGLLAIAPLLQRKSFVSFFRQSWLFFLVMGLTMFACRYPAFFCPHYFDPDEPQMLAQAITYETHPIPWRDIDGGSGGPLNSYALLWCLPFGVQPTYLTGRVFQTLCLLAAFIFLYLAGRRVAGDVSARIALLPAFLFVSWTVARDFVHYSSEEVSVFLLSWALYLLVRLSRQSGTPFLIFQLGFALGLLPFAKIQSVLLGGFLGLSALWIFFTNRRTASFDTFLLIAAAVIPTVFILGIVAGTGALPDFWLSYIRANQAYGAQYASVAEKLTGKIDLIAWLFDPGADIAILLLLAGVPALVLTLHLVFGLQKVTLASRNWFVWAVLFAFVALFTVLYSGNPYPHYEFFLLPAVTFLMAVNFRLMRLSRFRPPVPRALPPFFLAAIISSPFITANYLFPRCRLFVEWNDHTPVLLLELLLWLIGLSVFLTFGWLFARMFLKGCLPSFPFINRWHHFVPLAFLFPFFIIPEQILSSRPNEFRGKVASYLAQHRSAMDEAILRVRPAGGRLAIWGWAPEFAAETQTPLGTRDAVAPCSLPKASLDVYFRQRFLQDLRSNRPELFLEANGPANFSFRDAKVYGIGNFPEVARLVTEEYRLEQEINGMRLYVRRDLPPPSPQTRP